MPQAFPNVVAADRLLGLHDGRGGVRFFHNGRPTAQLQDAEARAPVLRHLAGAADLGPGPAPGLRWRCPS